MRKWSFDRGESKGRAAMLPVLFCLSCRAACIALTEADHLHFITCSCYRRLPFLRTARTRTGPFRLIFNSPPYPQAPSFPTAIHTPSVTSDLAPLHKL